MMIPHRFWPLVLTAVATLGAMPRTARAQRQAGSVSDSVPRVLVEALAGLQFPMMAGWLGTGKPQVVVGKLPSALTERLWVPPGATVLGGFESSGFGLAILRSRLPKDSLKAAYRREQLTRGWSAPPKRQLTPTGGFAPAPGSDADPDEGLRFCAGGTVLSLDVAPVEGIQEIRALAFAAGEYLCAPQRQSEAERFGPRHPTLANPPGTGDGFSRNCASWNSGGGGGSTRLTTTARLDEVLALYGKQLTDSGWTLADAQILGYSWTRRDSTGAFVELTLTARSRRSNPDCMEVEMRVNSRRP